MKIIDVLSWLDDNNYMYVFNGNKNAEINGFSSLSRYKRDTITWIGSEKNYKMSDCYGSIKIAVISDDVDANANANIENSICVDNPRAVYFSILNHFWCRERKCGIAEDSCIRTSLDPKNISIGHHCYIGDEVTIGNGTSIENNVTIDCPTRIGKNCIIHSGVVIGTDGFGYYIDDNNVPQKIDHYGGVIIGDNVEIGANTCIDRGTIDNTIIGSYVKIDNLCHIAHNVEIGNNSMIIAGSVICGSSHIEKNSYIAPGGIVKNQIKLGENAYVGLGAVVINDVESDTVVVGVPAKAIRVVKKGDK